MMGVADRLQVTMCVHFSVQCSCASAYCYAHRCACCTHVGCSHTRVATCDGEVHVVTCHVCTDVRHRHKSHPCVIVECGHIKHSTYVP